jgi:hypothetical protein
MGFVYMIKCNITNQCYVGSSMQKNKNDRLISHKGKNNKCVSKQIINRNNYEYIIIEDILDIDKKQLIIKEQKYIDKYDCINKQRAYRTKEQAEQDKREYNKQYNKNDKRKEYIKEYHQNNKEKIKKYKKEYDFFKKYNDVIADYINDINKY